MTGVLVALAILGAASPWYIRRPLRRIPTAPVTGVVPTATDSALLLDLVEVAVSTGVSIPRALAAVGSAVGGVPGEGLVRASASLVLGASWQAAWAGASSALVDVADVLETSWTSGSAPGPALRTRADQLRRRRRARARAAAGTLGVRLVLPLGLCFLPAFVLLGLVPMVLSLATGLLGGG
ncbi:type II secretion system F family protein [Cellulomonas sp. URHE0023]|uniref:type II secretion system F family protein n=1 Tax=Cellulomonas sp. URHE0023 TaxID=1380354 RepID=UPI000480BC66|nr:type II secretion system F family protein [Cellulomonas sp. URHE0023]